MMYTIPHKVAVLFNKLCDQGCGPIRRTGDEFRCRCPAHEDSTPSLYVGFGNGTILLNCKAGCAATAICDTLDHHQSDLFFTPEEPWVDPDTSVHTTDDQPSPPQPPTTETVATVTSRPDDRHEVYSAIIAALELSTSHFDAMIARGLSAEAIEECQFRTADSTKLRAVVDELADQFGRARLLSVPGFRERNGRLLFGLPPGLVLAVREIGGRIVALKVRSDEPSHAKYTWVSGSVSCGNPVHVPLGVPTLAEMVRVTEGELKADVAIRLSGVPTISAPGVTNWAAVIPVLQQLGAKRVLLAMDRDGKRQTLTATEQALYGLTHAGFTVELETWDGADGKGIDDLLAAGGHPEIVTGLAAGVRLREELAPPAGDAERIEPEPDPLPFQLDVLPSRIAEYCRQVAQATSTPPDFAGAAILITAAAALGNSRKLELKPNAWYEAGRFLVAAVGDPAAGKTPAIDLVTAPYLAIQQAAVATYKQTKSTHDQAKAAYDLAVKAARATPGSPLPPVPPPEPPPPERMVVSDVTVEGLAPILEGNPRGLLLLQDEISGWVGGMNQYKGGKGNDRQFYLSAWSGKSHLIDRKAQGSVPIDIPSPFLCVFGGIQPDMLPVLADPQGRSDGFLHRILFTFPNTGGSADWTDATVDAAVAGDWAATLGRLRAFALVTAPTGVVEPAVVKFSTAGKDAWVTWYDAHAAEMRDASLPARLLGPWGKLKSYAARFALVLHYLWLAEMGNPEGEIEAETVERAGRLIAYFKDHLRRVYARLVQAPDDTRRDEILDWIRQHGGQCTARDLLRARKVRDADAAKKFLRELEEHGLGRTEQRDAQNGRKVTWFVFDAA